MATFWAVEINDKTGLVSDVMEDEPNRLAKLLHNRVLSSAQYDCHMELWVNPQSLPIVKYPLAWAVPDNCKKPRPCVSLADNRVADLVKFCEGLEQ